MDSWRSCYYVPLYSRFRKVFLYLIKAAIENAGAEIITLALRRVNHGSKDSILYYIPKGVALLPNTSGARTANEAVRIYCASIH